MCMYLDVNSFFFVHSKPNNFVICIVAAHRLLFWLFFFSSSSSSARPAVRNLIHLLHTFAIQLPLDLNLFYIQFFYYYFFLMVVFLLALTSKISGNYSQELVNSINRASL